MGVLSCSRKGCDNIMCDSYIPEIGYICNSCKSEFKEHMERENPGKELTHMEIKESLEKFMYFRSSELGENEKTDIDSFFNRYTDLY